MSYHTAFLLFIAMAPNGDPFMKYITSVSVHRFMHYKTIYGILVTKGR